MQCSQKQSVVFRKELSWTGDAPSVPPLLNSGSIGRIAVVPGEVPGNFYYLFVMRDNLYHKRVRDFEILHGRNPVTAKDCIGGNDSAPPISKRDLWTRLGQGCSGHHPLSVLHIGWRERFHNSLHSLFS